MTASTPAHLPTLRTAHRPTGAALARAARWILCLVLLAAVTACGGSNARPEGAHTPDFIVLQLNDVYELRPVGGEGGLARVATLRAQLQAEAPVLTLLAGDFLSPSAIGLAKVDGQRLAGKQMVATFDALGLDATALGNHEFDVGEAPFRARLTESKFTWLAANVIDVATGAPFPKVLPHKIFDVGGVPVGVFTVTVNANPATWVRYDADYEAVARREVAALKAAGAQVVVALTHLDLEDDERLAARIADIDLVVGGHEHENWRADRGPDFTPVRKADANARTVFVHRIWRNAQGGQATVRSELVRMTANVPEQAATAAEAERWVKIAFDAFRADGLDPERQVTTAWTDLDGREASVRNGATVLTTLIGESLLPAAPTPGAATISLYNSGSIRIDDVIPKGAGITEYDVLRILPFGGKAMQANFSGALLARVLAAGEANRGKGGWLQVQGATANSAAGAEASTGWTVAGVALDPAGSYPVVLNDFLLLGKEDNLSFLTAQTEGLSDLREVHPDMRRLLIERLERGPAAAGSSVATRSSP